MAGADIERPEVGLANHPSLEHDFLDRSPYVILLIEIAKPTLDGGRVCDAMRW
jgi:hypothetical protein